MSTIERQVSISSPLADVGATPSQSVPSDTLNTPLKDSHGRGMNALNDFYVLPADADEHARLDIQHEMHRLWIGGLYWPSDHVRRILAPQEGQEHLTILDIGTGSGSWAIAMAEEFPHAEVVGIDVAPANVSRWAATHAIIFLCIPDGSLMRPVPPNCRFEVRDVTKGLDDYKHKVQAIHMRCVTAGIASCHNLLHHIFDILRPGGIFLFVDGDSFHIESGGYATQEDQNAPDFSWMGYMHERLEKGLIQRVQKLGPEGKGASPSNIKAFQSWMKEMTEWEEQDHRRFLIPIGPWLPDLTEQGRHASELLQQNIVSACGSWRPAILNLGYPADAVDFWIAKSREEITTMKPHLYVGWQASWALKRRVLGQTPTP